MTVLSKKDGRHEALNLDSETCYIDRILDALAVIPKTYWKTVMINTSRWVDAELAREQTA